MTEKLTEAVMEYLFKVHFHYTDHNSNLLQSVVWNRLNHFLQLTIIHEHTCKYYHLMNTGIEVNQRGEIVVENDSSKQRVEQ